ncbi:hypothetical protein D3C76_1753480 [compost metagenome]
MWQGGLRDIKHPEDVGAERPLQLFRRNILELLLWVLLGGIVNHNIQLTQLLHRLLNSLLGK